MTRPWLGRDSTVAWPRSVRQPSSTSRTTTTRRTALGARCGCRSPPVVKTSGQNHWSKTVVKTMFKTGGQIRRSKQAVKTSGRIRRFKQAVEPEVKNRWSKPVVKPGLGRTAWAPRRRPAIPLPRRRRRRCRRRRLAGGAKKRLSVSRGDSGISANLRAKIRQVSPRGYSTGISARGFRRPGRRPRRSVPRSRPSRDS